MTANDYMKNLVIENIEGSNIVIAHKKIIMPEAKNELLVSSFMIPEHSGVILPEHNGIIIPENISIGGIEYERNLISQRSR